MMWKEIGNVLGYMTIFSVPALLVLGIDHGVPILAFGMVMLVYPLGRRSLGNLEPDARIAWHEGVATFLDWLPQIYAVALVTTLAFVLHYVAAAPLNLSAAVGLGLSLWMTMLFCTCPAHDLIHRRNKQAAVVGHCLAGIAGYPVLGHEHLAHHARAGDTSTAEWPLVTESVWRFSARRAWRVLTDVYAPGSAFWLRGGHSRTLAGVRV